MTSETQHPLQILEKLEANIRVPVDVDVRKVASDWFQSFVSCIKAGDSQGVTDLFLEESFWRDILALTWDFRTLAGSSKIKQFLADRLPSVHMRAFKLKDEHLELQKLSPAIAWIQAFFEFETDVGLASGIFRIVPLADGTWKAHCMFTNLEDLKGFPEKVGHLRNAEPNHGKWEEDRQREKEFSNSDPVVLVVGGGQSGLEIAARLKCLGVSTLIIEKNDRIGDNWRNRYEALCLHDPVWYDHLPYIPFPATWPIYSPAAKLANWLESYAESMELNVWTSSTVVSASRDEQMNKWNVTVTLPNGRERILKVNHVVFATGFGDNDSKIPEYPGMDKFKGQILHSTQHKKAIDHQGKKVIVIGSCTAAHDIAVDYADYGVDVTMFQRSSTYVLSTRGVRKSMEGIYSENAPPVDVADRLSASYPNLFRIALAQRQVVGLAEADKDVLAGLKKVGFRVNMGSQNAGLFLLVWERGGGYYLDVGGSQYIIDGKVKLKNDSQIKQFTETGLEFENGSELSADTVLFATGLGDPRSAIRRICGDKVGDKCKKIWGLDEEYELNGCWRDLGISGLWYMMGNLAYCRFHSKHVALQIKAMEEGLFGTRYEA